MRLELIALVEKDRKCPEVTVGTLLSFARINMLNPAMLFVTPKAVPSRVRESSKPSNRITGSPLTVCLVGCWFEVACAAFELPTRDARVVTAAPSASPETSFAVYQRTTFGIEVGGGASVRVPEPEKVPEETTVPTPLKVPDPDRVADPEKFWDGGV
jgi:hypothetical protein